MIDPTLTLERLKRVELVAIASHQLDRWWPDRRGTDLSEVHPKNHPEIHPQNHSKNHSENHSEVYLKRLASHWQPGLPFELEADAPVSVFTTAQALSNLLDMGLADHPFTIQLTDWLVERQRDGWWYNPELESLSLPVWHQPQNLAARLLLTGLTAGVLARLQRGDLQAAVGGLDSYLQDSGAYLGFPQTSWLVTPALAAVHGTGSRRFREHWLVLDQLVDTVDFAAQVNIARLLQLSGLSQDTLVERVCQQIVSRYRPPGWGDPFQAPLSLSCLLVLSAHPSEYFNDSWSRA